MDNKELMKALMGSSDAFTHLSQAQTTSAALASLTSSSVKAIADMHAASSSAAQVARLTQRIFVSPMLAQIHRDHERHRNLIAAVTAQTDLQLAQSAAASKKLETFAQGIDSLIRSAEPIPFAAIQSAVDRATQTVTDRFQGIAIGPNQFTAAVAASNNIAKTIDALNNSVSMKVLRALQGTDKRFNEAVEVLQKTVLNEVPDKQSSLISFEGWLTILFSIFLFVVAGQQLTETKEELIQAFDSVEMRLIEKFDELDLESIDNYDYYVATSRLNVRSGPNTQSSIITLIHPNQKVKLIKNEGHWLYVEYFDLINEVPRTGWVYKRYLKKLP